MPGTYTIITRSDGSILTGAIYMQDHQVHLTFNTPGGVDDFSTNVSQMQSAADPGEVGTESLPTDLAGELQRLRKIIVEITGKTYWYESPSPAVALISAFNYANLAGASGHMPFDAMHIQGFTYANNAGDATNDIDFAAGQCRDDTNTHNLLGAALTKRLDANWVVGNNQGMLSTGAVANTDYYLWAIKRADTGVVDYLADVSSTAPTMPANYTLKRLIGWIRRGAGSIQGFFTYETSGGGLQLLWAGQTLDIDLAATLTVTRRTDPIRVPLNFSVEAHLNVSIDDATLAFAYIYCPDMVDNAPSITAAPLASIKLSIVSVPVVAMMTVRTSAAGLIAARGSVATMDQYRVVTLGFTWGRRN